MSACHGGLARAAFAWGPLVATGLLGLASICLADMDALRQQRRVLAHRQRRIIFNNDGDEPVYECKKPTPEALLACRTTGLLGSHVDSIFYCTWSSGFGMFTHNTRIGEIFTARSGIFSRNLTAEFISRGTDPLAIMVDFARRHNIELFWSMRMNDVHDGSYPELFPKWKKQHPECLLGSKENKPKGIGDGRAWAGVDYGQAIVRERAFRLIEEVCRNYDVDGIEMDFFRHPIFFKRHAWGQPCGREELDEMTSVIRRVRRMTEQVGLARGRPILVAVRVPDSVGYCKDIGLDLIRWLEEELIDILVVSGYFRLSPWEDMVKLGHRYGVPVYPCLSESRIKGAAGKERNSHQAYRARAMNIWRADGDGVYVFNFNYRFKPDHPIWRELGDPDVLERLDKTYYVAYRGFWGVEAYLRGGSKYLKLPTLCPERPVKLAPGSEHVVQLTVGDNVWAVSRQGLPVSVRLMLQAKPASPGAVTVVLNGQRLDGGRPANGWLEYPVAPHLVRVGSNSIEVRAAAGNSGPVTLADAKMDISYGGQK